MTTRKVQNPNQKGGNAFIWAVLAVVLIAALVIGIIVANGRSAQNAAKQEGMVSMDGINVQWTEGEDMIHLTGPNADAPTGELFEDFSCSHCADLHVATDEAMIEALKAGDINIELRPMVTQDGARVGHSTKGLAAELALINAGDLDAAFTLRNYLYANQQAVFSKLENDDMADLAVEWGASKEAEQDIRDGKFIEPAQKMSMDNLKLQQDEKGEAWTPRVWIDGEDVSPEDRDNWVEVLKNS